ncbi:hypothetical protein [Planctomicrobium piriforme]|uniref:Uncharacterized protein n=1 Tax=Planctomicrobium piriforme TaxID=1576369 RepID=A0A1I3NSL2_9PLAN|nr:hypothetical protein [Planctomicrobium piriforme]SFJ11726.1 hypothetical protein SAMN05421753_115174 [Planctomicrobium piriforme]
MKDNFKLFGPHDLFGILLLAMVGVFLLSSNSYVIEFLGAVLHVPDNSNPDAEAPWSIIRQHFLIGIASAIGGVLIVLLMVVTGACKKSEATTFLLIPSMVLLPNVFESIMIWARCNHFFDPAKIVCPWQTISEFNSDPWRQIIFIATLLGVLIASWLSYRFSKVDKADNESPQAATPSTAIS